MTITNVPGPVLSIAGFDALTDAVATCCLCPQLVHVGLHCPLTGGVVGSGVVDEESAVVLFDHGSSIRGQGCRMGGCCASSSIEQQRGDCFDACLVCLNGDPWHGVTLSGALPDHGIFVKGSGETVSVCHVGCPLATVRIEGAECFGLDGDGVSHVLCFVPCIVDPSGDPTTTSRTVPTLSHLGGDRWDDEAD